MALKYKKVGLIALLALGGALMPSRALAQAEGVANYYDPLPAGYVYRASEMLKTANPLGTLDQINAQSTIHNAQSALQSVQALALEGVALFERKDPACVEVLLKVAKEYPTYPQATQALLTVGDWYWYQKDWHQALEYFDKVDISRLANGQRYLYSYRKALAYLNCGVPEKAAPLFNALKGKGDFSRAADYYSAYILYLNGDYDNAYDEFKRIAEAESSSPESSSSQTSGRTNRNNASRRPNLTPGSGNYVSDGIEPLYYMTQIEYLRGKYDDVIDHSATIMAKRPVEELLPELHRVSGLSYFKKGDLASARGHLEEFVNSTDSPNDDAVYALAATEYADGDYDMAKKHLQTLTDRNNAIAQGAYLYLGQIAEREGNMNAAAMAFRKASDMAFDKDVAQTALYNYITATSKGGNVPFASSIAMHEEFLQLYPSSPYASRVEESLASAFFHENNYTKALEAINRVKRPSASTQATKQKILYKLGCSEISSGQLSSAVTHLREAAGMTTSDATIAAESSLWLGDALYRLNDYTGAEKAYNAALSGNLAGSNETLARYGLAYSQFQNSQWKDAEKNFAAVATSRNASADIKADALIREADCLFYSRQFQNAAAKYKEAAASSNGDADYATFRYAVVSGVNEGSNRELQLLDAFLAERPNSRWTAEALLEAARTATAMERKDKAASYYDRLLDVRPDLPEVGEALFNKAIHLENEGDSAGALEAFLSLENRAGKEFETEAVAGVMRNTSDINQRTEYARRLLTLGGVLEEDAEDARFYDAYGLLHSENPQAGIEALETLAAAPDNLSGARAAVELGEWYLDKGDSKKALEVLEKFTDAGSIHSYWLARGFIALADAYKAEGNEYLAKEYLKSLRENYPGEEEDIINAIEIRL